MTFCKNTAHLTAIAVALTFLGNAQASYTVIDDDLLPTAIVDARHVSSKLEQYDIPFAKNSYTLGTRGRRVADQLITSLQGASIKIIGRPDAQPGAKVLDADNTTPVSLASARTNSLRQYLLRQGIPASSITTTADDSPNPQANGSIYPSQITVSRPPSYDRTQLQPQPAQPAVVANSPALISPAPVVNKLVTPDRDQLIQFINQSVRSGAMEASVALTLMAHLLNESPANNKALPPVPTPPSIAPQTAVQPKAPAPLPAPPSVAPQIAVQPKAPAPAPAPVMASILVATPTLARKPAWVLSKTMTLRDNVNAWSKLAGWNPVRWAASNFFEVTETLPVEGDFPDVLRQVADASGLNICAHKTTRTIKVTDAGVDCRE